MRATLLLSALTLASLAVAQRPTGNHESEVWEAYVNLRTNDSIKFEMDGYDQAGSFFKHVHTTMYWRTSTDPRTGLKSRAEVEVDISESTAKGDITTYRIVGDGATLYRYDLVKGEVSSTTYGFYGNKVPASYAGTDAAKLISQLRAVTPGPTAYLARILSEVNPIGNSWTSRFASWDPGRDAASFEEAWKITPADATTVSGATKKVQATMMLADRLLDPLTDVPYTRGDPKSSRWFFYRVEEDAPRQTMAVHLQDMRATDEEPEQWTIDKWCLTKLSAGRKLQLAFNAVPDSAPPDWAFLPYTGTDGAKFRPVNRGN